jgi:hypothetical protein
MTPEHIASVLVDQGAERITPPGVDYFAPIAALRGGESWGRALVVLSVVAVVVGMAVLL